MIAKFKGKEGPGLKNPTYAAQIEATDRAIGRVIDEIDRLRLTDNTLVIFTSDNGGWEGATDNETIAIIQNQVDFNFFDTQPDELDYAKNIYWVYGIVLKKKYLSFKEIIIRELKKKGYKKNFHIRYFKRNVINS